MGKVETRAGGLPPIKVFLVLVALLATGVTAYLVTREDAPTISSSTPLPTIEPPDVPTEAEAIQLVRDLQGLSYEAYERRDASLLSEFALDGSAYAKDVHSEIEQMIDDNVQVLIVKKRIPMRVISVSSTEIVVRGRFYSDASFTGANGKEVSKPRKPEIRSLQWTLSNTEDGWRIEKVLITKVRKVEK